MRYTVRPISDRTAFTGKHEYTPFRASWSDTLKLIDRELAHLAATDVVIEVDVTEGAIRLDGMLRSDAKVASPAVRLAFQSKVGPLVYATDRYVGRWRGGPADWQENVRAIALGGLEALRRVDRYGITKRGEQYAGWRQITGGTRSNGFMAAEHAKAVLGLGMGSFSQDDLRAAHRRARAAAHPDRHDGDRSRWDQVEQAARVLGATS